MALEEYLGAIVLEVDGQEVEIESFDNTTKTGRKLVKTMNRTGRAKGFSRGIAEYDLKIVAIIPLTGDLDWDAIEGAKLRQYPLTTSGESTSYLDCFTVEVGESYTVDGEAKRNISMGALRKVHE